MSIPPPTNYKELDLSPETARTTIRRSHSRSTKPSVDSSNELSPKSFLLSTPIALSQFAHQHLTTTPQLLSSSAPPSTTMREGPQPRKWVSRLKEGKEKTPVPKLVTPILDLPQTSTSSTDDGSEEYFSLSPRSRGGFCHTVHNFGLQKALDESMNKVLEQLAEIRKGLHYGDMSLQEIDQTVELYVRQRIRGFNDSDIRPKNLLTILCKDMASEESPLVSICCRHLGKYAVALSDTNPILKELKSVIVAMVTFNRTTIKRLEEPDHEETPLDILIAILQKYSKHHIGTALSYMILGTTDNQLEELLEMLKKWNSIDGRMSDKIKDIMDTRIYRHTPSQSHQFKQKDIRDTFVRDACVVLPRMVTINCLPFQLNGYDGGRDKMLVDLLSNMISDIHYAGLNREITQGEIMRLIDELMRDNTPPQFLKAMLSVDEIESLVDDFRGEKKLYGELKELLHPVQLRKRVEILLTDLANGTDTEPHSYLKAVLSEHEIERIVNDFREKNEFPEEFMYLVDPLQMERAIDDFLIKKIAPAGYVKTLLGLGSISARLQAFIFFLDTFPLLKEFGFICRQKQGNVRISFNVKSDPMNCYQPITFIVYPKLSDDPRSFAIDQERPLAEVTIGWTGFPVKIEGILDGYTHSETLEIINCEFYGEGSEVERRRILDALGLQKRFTLKATLTNHINSTAQDSQPLARPSIHEADGTDRSLSSSAPASSSSIPYHS